MSRLSDAAQAILEGAGSGFQIQATSRHEKWRVVLFVNSYTEDRDWLVFRGERLLSNEYHSDDPLRPVEMSTERNNGVVPVITATLVVGEDGMLRGEWDHGYMGETLMDVVLVPADDPDFIPFA